MNSWKPYDSPSSSPSLRMRNQAFTLLVEWAWYGTLIATAVAVLSNTLWYTWKRYKQRVAARPRLATAQDVELSSPQMDSADDDHNFGQVSGPGPHTRPPPTRTVQWIERLCSSLPIVIAFVCFYFATLLSVADDRIHVAAGTILLWLTSSVVFLFFLPSRHRDYYRIGDGAPLSWSKKLKRTGMHIVQALQRKWRERKGFIFAGFFVTLIVALVGCLLLAGLCWYPYNSSFTSTRVIRKFGASSCRGGRPCVVYLTLPTDASTGINVHFHTNRALAQAQVRFDMASHESSDGYSQRIEAHTLKMPKLEVDRFVHWVHLSSLEPNTTYYFVVGDAKAGFSTERKFRTGPSGGPFAFVTGGDSAVSHNAVLSNQRARRENPLFGLLGGDIAYVAAEPTCYRVWDAFLHRWEEDMVTSDDYMIPLVSAIGNHEVYQRYHGNAEEDVLYYLRYFLQDDDTTGTPPAVRRTYHHHLVGDNTLLLVLDTDHVASIEGEQTEWLGQTLQAYENIQWKIAFFHVPAYAAFDRSLSRQEKIQENWIPLFDQFGVKVIFQNHDHVWQRTKYLKNNEVDSSGSVYMGNGAWGRSRTGPVMHWYTEKVATLIHFFRVNVENTHITVSTIASETGLTFDELLLSAS